MGGMNPEHEPWLYENVGRASDPWPDYKSSSELLPLAGLTWERDVEVAARVSGGAAVGQPPVRHFAKGQTYCADGELRVVTEDTGIWGTVENEVVAPIVQVSDSLSYWFERVSIAEGELRNLRDDKTKLESALVHERCRVRQLQQQLSLIGAQALAQPRQPLSAGWHSLPDIAAPEGRKAMPARALRPPKDGHPMPWLQEP